MELTAATDILFDTEPAPERLRMVAARAFDVEPSEVSVGLLLDRTQATTARILLQRQPEDARGDFPVWYGLAVEASLLDHVDRAIDEITGELGLTALSDASDDASMTLHLPDGSEHIVSLEPNADEAFLITPEMRHLIDNADKTGRRDRRPGRVVAR